MRRVAILGGAFNPVHQGHLRIAEAALIQHKLDGVIWVPTRQPSHKPQAELADFLHRYEMVKLAIAAHPAFRLANIESNSAGTSFAIDTLKMLQASDLGNQWYWILGLDAFQSLPRWKHRDKLAAECCWLVAPRATSDSALPLCHRVVEQMQSQSIWLRWHLLCLTPLDISSSGIRHRCQQHDSIQTLVPLAVQSYVATHRLYRADQYRADQ